MLRPSLLLLLLALTFTGCQTLWHRDQVLLQSHGVSGPLYAKMSHHEPLSLDDIIVLSQKRVPGPFIVHYLQPTYFVYKLSQGDVMRLKQAGVEEGVIGYLLSTPSYSPANEPLWYQEEPRFSGSDRDYWRQW